MSSVSYQANPENKNISWRLTKAAILLLISVGLYLFSIDFPFYTVFEPQSPGWVIWVSYANDLLQPFALYFLLCLGERWLKTWQVRALIAVTIPVFLEFGQLFHQLFYNRFRVAFYFGAFDLLDIVMYIISVGLAVIVERKFFATLFKNW